ncbi:larval cuticle protein A2B-like [Anoplophora glabripennis]|uniref:larval cuticle protein A2B-like n=1 Tax=Anoplophora glabripennis TaxID=217634 RepID=UPI0008748C4B|nr:larval cuticle protein A2B-like [Anoplophora glabripennis]
MHVHCENLRIDKNFPIFTLGWAIVLSAVISVEQRWCNAVNEESYSFNYVINVEGIISQHNEHRHFDVTRGSYSFLQPDGQVRVVEYQVDTDNGFKAFVKYRKISSRLEGHLRFPKDFSHPVVLAVPVSLISSDLFNAEDKYPNFPH